MRVGHGTLHPCLNIVLDIYRKSREHSEKGKNPRKITSESLAQDLVENPALVNPIPIKHSQRILIRKIRSRLFLEDLNFPRLRT